MHFVALYRITPDQSMIAGVYSGVYPSYLINILETTSMGFLDKIKKT